MMNPDEILSRAAAYLRADEGLRLEFLEKIGIEPMLMVSYDDGTPQEWAGPVADWPDMVKEYDIQGSHITHWDLTIGKIIASHDWSDIENPLDPSIEAQAYLDNLKGAPA